MTEKCSIGKCDQPRLYKQVLCKQHWMMVPWQVRRHISKLLNSNDMRSDAAHDEMTQRAYAYVVRMIKEGVTPPRRAEPASVKIPPAPLPTPPPKPRVVKPASVFGTEDDNIKVVKSLHRRGHSIRQIHRDTGLSEKHVKHILETCR